jgi:hypothetical protein
MKGLKKRSGFVGTGCGEIVLGGEGGLLKRILLDKGE